MLGPQAWRMAPTTRRARRAPHTATLFRHAPWTLRRSKLTEVSSHVERRYMDAEVPLRRTGNSGMPTTEDAEAVARPCIDTNFAGGETTDRQGCRN